MKAKTYGILAAIILAGSSLALAGPKDMREGGPMRMMDLNQDGSVSADEIRQFQQQHFQEADTNGDGSVDEAEFKVMQEKIRERRMAMRFKHLDQDGDGKLSQQELQEPLQKGMSHCDKNGDGNLSAEELSNCRPRHRGEHHEMHGRPDADEPGPAPEPAE